MEVLKNALSEMPLLEVTGDVDNLTAAALERAVEDALAADGLRLLLDLSECPLS